MSKKSIRKQKELQHQLKLKQQKQKASSDKDKYKSSSDLKSDQKNSSTKNNKRSRYLKLNQKKNKKRGSFHTLATICKIIAGVVTAFIASAYIWNIYQPKQVETANVREHIGKNVTAFQAIGHSSPNEIVYTGNKNRQALAWKVNMQTRKISKPEPILNSKPDHISYLTQVQLYHNLKKYQIKKDLIIYKGKKYIPVYNITTNANLQYLIPATKHNLQLNYHQINTKGKKRQKRMASVFENSDQKGKIKLKPCNLYVTDLKAEKVIKKKYGFDTKRMLPLNVVAEKNGDINYYVMSNVHINPYKITVSANNTVLIANGHENNKKR